MPWEMSGKMGKQLGYGPVKKIAGQFTSKHDRVQVKRPSSAQIPFFVIKNPVVDITPKIWCQEIIVCKVMINKLETDPPNV